MSDETQAGIPVGDDGMGSGAGGTPTPETKRKTWLWVAIGIGALVLIAVVFLAAQPSAGGTPGWLLFLRGGVTVPQVVGMTQSAAENSIAQAGLKTGTVSEEPTLAVAPGIVVHQTPAASTKVEADSAVDMAVSSVPSVTVPSVVGKTESDASAALAEQGLPTGQITYVYDSNVKAGYVKSQDPAAGTETKVGATVALTVSKGQQTGKVPNVVGLTQTDATDALEAAGFKVNATKASSLDVAAGDVMSQSPAAGATANTGSTVTITVSKGAPPQQPSEPQTPTAPETSTPTPPEQPEKPANTVDVPDVVGMRPLEAIRALRQAKLTFTIEFVEVSENYLKVASQDPKAGAEVEPGTSVTIRIGLPGFLFGHEGELPSRPETGTPTPTPTPTPLPSNPTTGSEGSSAPTP